MLLRATVAGISQGCYSEAPMFTIFSVPKPFVPPLDVIQRNAIRSWRRGHPDAQLILFGDEEGTAALAADVQAEHH